MPRYAQVDDQRVGAVFRTVRVRRGWRQLDVARLAGVSSQTVSRIERGHLATLTIQVARAVARALEIRLELAPWSRHGDLARLATADHADLVELILPELTALGWHVRAEVSFSERGERGFVDILAWHAPARTLLVVEVKTAIVDVGEIVGILDRKQRLAGRIAERFGWRPASIGTALLIRAGRTNRRRIAEHRSIFGSALPADGRRLRAWLRHPDGPIEAVAFWSDSRPGAPGQRRTSVRRVRRQSEAPAAARWSAGRAH